MENFVENEIIEMARIHNLDSKQIFELYLICDLNIKNLKEIENLDIRSAVYECLCLFPKKLFETNLISKILKIMNTMHDKKEKNYLVEKKVILKIKEIFNDFCEKQDDDDLKINTLYEKIAYIITRRLYFIQDPDLEYEGTNTVELSTLLQQIATDIFLYYNTLRIITKKNQKNELNENYLKSFIMRILWLLIKEDPNVTIELKRAGQKSINFINYKKASKNYTHFYARVLLTKPVYIEHKNLGLNGGYHYLSKRKIIEPNSFNDTSAIKNNLHKFVDLQNNVKYYIDKEMIEALRGDIQNQLKKDQTLMSEWGDCFSEIKDLSHNELNGILKMEKHKKKMKKNYYTKPIDNNEELKKVIEKIEKNNTTGKDTKKLETKKLFLEKQLSKKITKHSPDKQNKWIQRDFSYAFIIKIYLNFIEFFEDYEDPLHFAIYFDFRGRFYHNSMAAPSNGWPFRFMYHFGEITEEDKKNKIEYLLKNEDHSEITKKMEEKFGELSERQKNNGLWVLKSIGDVTIKKKEILTMGEFIEEGWKNYTEKRKTNDLLENSELTYYYLIMDQIKIEKWNRYLIKDISGSIFQNAAIILGVKNEEALNFLNIDGKDYMDPYFKLIDKLKEKGHIPKEMEALFTRKTLKKAIMTKYYNATLHTSFNYFIQEARLLEAFDQFKDDKGKLFENFKNIFVALKNLEKETFFENSSEDYNNFLKKENIRTIEHEDFVFELTCYKLAATRIDLTVDGRRATCVNYQTTKEEFTKKTNNSMLPNIFHGEDSSRARILIKEYNDACFSIHDAFAVSYRNAEKLVSVANETFDINKKNDAYMAKNNITRKLSTLHKIQ